MSREFVARLVRHVPPHKFGRYLLVGIWNTAFGYGSFALLTLLLDPYIPASYMAASLLSSVLNITVSFLGYKWLVFKTRGNYFREWVRCLMVYSGGILLGLALLPPTVFIVGYFTGDSRTAPYIAGALLLGIQVIVSFLGHKNFTFGSVRPIGTKGCDR